MVKAWVKGLSISIGLVLAVALSGCGSKGKNVKTENVPPVPVVAVEEQVSSQDITESGLEDLKKQAQAEGALNTIYFDFDNYNLKSEAVTTLNKTAAWLTKNPTVKITIEGNCDERGTMEYNVALGERRANSAEQYLNKLGVAADRLSAISYGKEKPICTEHNESCWWKNRRDDFNVVK